MHVPCNRCQRYACACTAGPIVLFLLSAFLALPGCNQTPVQQQATAIDVAAVTTAAAARVVADAAGQDARATCPEGSDPSCLDPVEARWRTADEAIDGIRLALGAWLLADRIAHEAGPPIEITDVVNAVADVVRFYEQLRAFLAEQHIEIPPMPPIVLALLPEPPTSGGSTP